MSRRGFDYVIVGAGSAGCVLAARLSEDPEVRVLLLEAGGRDLSLYLHMPATFAWPLQGVTYNWAFLTEPEPLMDHRIMDCPRGKVIGGSSTINGMAYVRGHALDYDRWEEEGATGWAYRHVLPYFKRAETRAKGADLYHGGDGPLHVTTPPADNPLYRAFIEAGREAGYPVTEDMNGFQQEGLGVMDSTTRRGRRWSASKAYLRPARRRPNLQVELGTLALRVDLDGRRAVGVTYARDGARIAVRAEREVILAAGAIGSPQLLQLSGVGDADRLRALGIGPAHDLPGVGESLQDHLEIYVQHACTRPVSLWGVDRLWRRLAIGAQWLLLGRGIGASNLFEAGGFIRSAAGVRHPDLQYHFLPLAVSYDGRSAHQGHGFQAHVGPMRPESRGHVHLRRADAREAPSIRFNYLQAARDRREMLAAIRLTREVFAQAAFDPWRGDELAPGADARSDDDLLAFVRARAESAYHPCGTCRMGTGEDAVVDPEGRVRGLEALRVVDASIMPSIVSGNLNAPTIMLAEKLADVIRGRPPLPPLDAPVWIHPEWQSEQR
jgi:choline dehydrogenase